MPRIHRAGLLDARAGNSQRIDERDRERNLCMDNRMRPRAQKQHLSVARSHLDLDVLKSAKHGKRDSPMIRLWLALITIATSSFAFLLPSPA